jgi:hypothetical protein
MKLFEAFHSFEAPWSAVTLANWNKYPNPLSSHVISCDTISRTIDDNKLITERLLAVKQPVPRILGYLGFNVSELAHFHEISTLDLKTREFKASTVNLDLRQVMVVNETVTLSEHLGKTLFKQEAVVQAQGVFDTVGKVIEDMAVSRFKSNAHIGKQALEEVTARFRALENTLEAKIEQKMEELKELNQSISFNTCYTMEPKEQIF